jgi:hypothetical protein
MGWGVGLRSINLSGLNSPQLAAQNLHRPEVRHSRMLLAGIQGGMFGLIGVGNGLAVPALRTVRAVLPHTALQSVVSSSGLAR